MAARGLAVFIDFSSTAPPHSGRLEFFARLGELLAIPLTRRVEHSCLRVEAASK